MTTAAFWDKIADSYAARPVGDQAAYEKTLERTAAYLSPSDKVLEVGCGTGTTALILAPLVGDMTGADISPEMIRIARGKAEGVSNARFVVASADVQHGQYDAVVAMNLIHLLEDWRGGIRDLAAQVRPGGHLITKTGCLSQMNPIIRLAIPVMQLIGKAPYVATFDAATLEAEMKSAGLDIIEAGYHNKGKGTTRFIVARKPA